MPALIFLGFSLNTEYWRIFFLALLGGWLGVLFMIPLRRQLIVKEHGNLTFPEGTACADVLVAGERGGSFAGRVFWGLGLGGVYTFAMNTLGMWPSPAGLPAEMAARLVVPREHHFGISGSGLHHRAASCRNAVCRRRDFLAGDYAGDQFFRLALGQRGAVSQDDSDPQMSPDQLWASYIRPIGAGAVAASGLITLIKTLPTIFSALSAGVKDVRAKQGVAAGGEPHRTRYFHARGADRLGSDCGDDVGAAEVQADSGSADQGFSDLMAALFVVVFGFLFVTVASRISGLIGNSSNPISGMTIATLMATCAVFLVIHWTATPTRCWR